MKILKYKYTLIVLLTFLMFGCEKEYEDFSRVTYFADITMEGDEQVFIATNSTYDDAGASSSENGEPIDTKITSTVDVTTPGSYSVNYSATNSDGYSKTVSRSVIVYDANVNTDDISGGYTGDVVRNGTISYAGNPITLTKVAGLDGVYRISDWIGGFYDVGYGYGTAYRFTGYIQINASNEVVLLGMSNAWGDPFDSVVGTYDPGTKTISYTANWLGGAYAFVVDLTKN